MPFAQYDYSEIGHLGISGMGQNCDITELLSEVCITPERGHRAFNECTLYNVCRRGVPGRPPPLAGYWDIACIDLQRQIERN